MKIEDIRVFLKLAKTLSFFATADALYLSPSAVSYSIKNLEKQLDVKLFHRSSHGVALTEKGKVFYRDMRAMMADWEEALDHLREEPEGQKNLRVGLISMTLQRDFSNIISSFIGENPEVQLSLSVCPVEDPTGPLRKGKLDLAFVYRDAVEGFPAIERRHLVSVGVDIHGELFDFFTAASIENARHDVVVILVFFITRSCFAVFVARIVFPDSDQGSRLAMHGDGGIQLFTFRIAVDIANRKAKVVIGTVFVVDR